MEHVYKQLVLGLENFFKEQGFKKAVLGCSGGVDSSVTLKLAVDALGKKNVTVLLLPEMGLTDSDNLFHAKKLCEFFEVEYFQVPLNPFLVDFTHLPWGNEDEAYQNTKARLRMTLLYNYANAHNCLVLGTSNLSELMTGYATKHGDLAADVEVLGELLKTEVWELAEHMGIPKEIIEKKPSAELYAGQTDEKDLGCSYEELDAILKNHTLDAEKLIRKGMKATNVRRILKKIEDSEHKRHMPEVLKVNKKK